MSRARWLLLGAIVVGAAGATATVAEVRGQGHGGHGAPSPSPSVQAPRRITSEELHRLGGVPRGWRFTLPPGDAARGRQAFADLECYKCHVIQGAGFPEVAAEERQAGPELTGMGHHHPGEYFAESILSPNAVILEGHGFTGPDGLSIMPSFADSLTVPQLVDLVAFLKSQTRGGAHAHDSAAGGRREKVIGDYRIRLVYHAPAHDHGGQPPAAGSPGTGTQPDPSPPLGHLMAFIASAEHGGPVPYLPVRATFFVSGKPPRSVRLAPMLGAEGFHYGADVAIPDGTDTIRLTISAPSVTLMPAVKGRYAKSTTALFEWR
ncbi:MAG: iron transporter [Candidatus Rokuibacteriota bacterium]